MYIYIYIYIYVYIYTICFLYIHIYIYVLMHVHMHIEDIGQAEDLSEIALLAGFWVGRLDRLITTSPYQPSFICGCLIMLIFWLWARCVWRILFRSPVNCLVCGNVCGQIKFDMYWGGELGGRWKCAVLLRDGTYAAQGVKFTIRRQYYANGTEFTESKASDWVRGKRECCVFWRDMLWAMPGLWTNNCIIFCVSGRSSIAKSNINLRLRTNVLLSESMRKRH